MPLDPRKTVFVGGVPRPLKASEYSRFKLLFLLGDFPLRICWLNSFLNKVYMNDLLNCGLMYKHLSISKYVMWFNLYKYFLF